MEGGLLANKLQFKHKENTLCLNCNVYNHFAEHSPFPIILLDKSLALLFANKVAQRQILKNISNWPAVISNIIAQKNRISNKYIEFSYTIKKECYTFYLKPVRNGQQYYLYAHRVTREFELNQKLQKTTSVVAEVLNNIPADVAMFNNKHEYQYINKVAIKNDELRQWLIGKTDFDYCRLKGIDTSMAEERAEMFRKAITTRKDVDYVDVVKTSDGNTKYILRRFHPVVGGQTEHRVIGYAVDITSQIEGQQKLQRTYDMLFDNQVLIKQMLGHYVHHVKHPMANIEGLLEHLVEGSNNYDSETATLVKYLASTFDTLKKSFSGLTERLDNAFYTFESELAPIGIRAEFNHHAQIASQQFHKRFKLRFSLPAGSDVLYYYAFMAERVLKQLFAYIVEISNKDCLNISIASDKTQYYHTIEVKLNNVHLSNATLTQLYESVNMYNSVKFESKQNPIADVACILNCSNGQFNHYYNNNNLCFKLGFPTQQTHAHTLTQL